MTRPPRRLVLITAAIVLVSGFAVGALASVSTSSVTRARLERSLPRTFSSLYVQQAKLLGHKGVTVQSLHAKAQCDKGGPDVADVGPGADWICLMSWRDPNIDQTVLPGKFEMNVHSNDCYTAGGPSKIVGLLTITDVHGNDVPNPVFEFDGCFDPKGSNRPTGVVFPKPSTSKSPSAVRARKGTLIPDTGGRVAPLLTCSAGNGGCAGTVRATLDGRRLGSALYVLGPGKQMRIGFGLDESQRRSGGALVLTIEPVIGTAPNAHTARTVAAGPG